MRNISRQWHQHTGSFGYQLTDGFVMVPFLNRHRILIYTRLRYDLGRVLHASAFNIVKFKRLYLRGVSFLLLTLLQTDGPSGFSFYNIPKIDRGSLVNGCFLYFNTN